VARPERFELPTFWFVGKIRATRQPKATDYNKYKETQLSTLGLLSRFGWFCTLHRTRTEPAQSRLSGPAQVRQHLNERIHIRDRQRDTRRLECAHGVRALRGSCSANPQDGHDGLT